MSHTIPIDQASARLAELIHALAPGDEIVVTENDKPVARIVPSLLPVPLSSRAGGSWEGKFEILDEGDDVILDHFKEYMP